MNKLLIIHFQPVELYPPVMNLLNYIPERKDVKVEVLVCSMKDEGRSTTFKPVSESIRIIRTGTVYKKPTALYKLQRYVSYIQFYMSVLIQLIKHRPVVVLYFDTLSSFPAYVYKKYIRKESYVMVHYHEYSSTEEYDNGMKLNQWFHKLEKKLYKDCFWVSQTNKDRMEKFIADHAGIQIPNTYILPNYPPEIWKSKQAHSDSGKELLKIIYVGALSMQNMYVKEFADWVIQQGNKVSWHILSTNITSEALSYITSLHAENIEFKGGTDYDHLPEIISKYDVGVILYKGHIANYVYNAPNKLFEYYACGLDVWFPAVMKGSLPYSTTGSYPKIISLDFDFLYNEDVYALVDKTGLRYKPSEYYSENALAFLVDKIKIALAASGRMAAA